MRKTTDNPGCTFIRENLFSYQENTLSSENHQLFEDHVRKCSDCVQFVNKFLQISNIFEAKRVEEPNPFIHTRTILKIESALERGNKPSFAFSKKILQPLMLSTGILMAVVIGFALGKQVDSARSMNLSRQNDIQFMKSDLYFTDFMDEDNTYFANH
jgi:hypothetical protein